jgi:hypothetical protein
LAPRANKGLSEPFPTGLGLKALLLQLLWIANRFRAEQFDSSQLEKEGTRFALISSIDNWERCFFQKQSRNGFKNYHLRRRRNYPDESTPKFEE